MADEKKTKEEEREESIAKMVSKAVAEAIEQALPVAVGVAMNAQKRAPAMTKDEQKEVQEWTKGQRCFTCRQLLRACKNQHRMAVVFPPNEILWAVWPGLRLNGVAYDSGDPNVRIPIPADWDMEAQISAWSAREIINIRGRKKTRRSGFVNTETGEIERNPEPVGF